MMDAYKDYYLVIVAGSRGLTDYKFVEDTLDKLLKEKMPNIVIVSGHAKGADELGEIYAKEHGLSTLIMPADWGRHGLRAGYIRNRSMAAIADGCVVFWDGVSPGSKMMIDLAFEVGIHLRVVRYEAAKDSHRN